MIGEAEYKKKEKILHKLPFRHFDGEKGTMSA